MSQVLEGEKAVAKASEGVEMGTISGPLVSPLQWGSGGRSVKPATIDAVHVVLRVLCLMTSVVGFSLMVTAKQSGNISLYGFQLPVYSSWSFADSFEYLVGVTAAVAAHSSFQLLLSLSRLRKKSVVIPSQTHAWVIYACDQVFAYALMSAGSAASGVTSLNRTGIRHTALPNFCKPLHIFCTRVATSIAFTFISCFLLAASTVLDVIWLNSY